MKRALPIVLAVLAAGFLVAYFASPLLAVRALVRAAETGDEAGLSRQVDFPAFRESLKGELNDRLLAEMRQRLGQEDSALAGFGMLLAPSIVSGAVDALVTPQAVAAMVTEARAPAQGERSSPPTKTPSDRPEIKQSYGYRNLDTFVLTLTDEARPGRRLHLLMDRRGLFDWKLSGIDLAGAEAPAA